MDILQLLPPFFYAVTAVFWIFLILISYKKFMTYRQEEPLFSKLSLIVTFFASTAAITSIIFSYQYLNIDHPESMIWVDWAILSLNTTAAIVTSILYTHHSIGDAMEKLLNKENRLNDLKSEKENFTHTLDQKERYIVLQEIALNVQKTVINASDPNSMLDRICHQFCEHPSFNVAWIGFADIEATQLPISFFHDNAEPRFLSNEFVSILDANDPYANGPSSQAMLTNRTIVIEDTQSDLRFSQWHTRAKFSQIRSVLAFPMFIKEGDRAIGVLTLYSQDYFKLEDPEIALIQELTHTITRHISYLNTHLKIEKQSQQNLKKLKVLEQVINAVPANIFWKDRDLRYVGANHAFLKCKDLNSLSAIIGKSDEELGWTSTQSEMSLSEKRILHDKKEILNQIERSNHRWLLSNKTCYHDQDNHLLGLIGVHIDITQHYNTELSLKRNEKHYRELIENIPDVAVQGFDENRRIIDWNKQSAAMFGYTKEEAIGKKIEELLYPEEMHVSFINKVDSWLTQNRPIAPSISQLRHKNGKLIKVHIGHMLVDKQTKTPEFFNIYLKV